MGRKSVNRISSKTTESKRNTLSEGMERRMRKRNIKQKLALAELGFE